MAGLHRQDDLPGVVSVLGSWQQTMRVMGESLTIAEGLQITRLWSAPIFGQILSFSPEPGNEEQLASATYRLAMVDSYAAGLIELLLGMGRTLEALSVPTFENKIAAIDWARSRSLYLGPLASREVVEQLESLHGRLNFERTLEKKIVSPLWLHCETAALGLVRFLDAATKALVAEFETAIGEEVEKQLAASNHVVAAQLSIRSLEALNKLSKHLEAFKVRGDQYQQLNRSKEYEWPAIDWSGLQQRLKTVRTNLVLGLSRCVGPLRALPENNTWPDFFGQVYSVLADETLDAMILGDEGLFERLYPPFFHAALVASDKLRQKVSRADNRAIALIGAPLLDLLAISSYAEVFSALDQKRFADIARPCWARYLSAFPDDAARRGTIELLLAVAEPTMWTSAREMRRMAWERAVEAILRGRNILTERGDFFARANTEPRHPSPLVRAFAENSSLHTGPQFVFFAVYLLARPEAAGLEVPHEVEAFRRSLARQDERPEEEEDQPHA